MLIDQSGTKWKILELLREQHDVTMKDFKEKISVSPSTINEHLSKLQALNLIDKHSERDGPGRPHYVYSLTPDGKNLFPHAYATLSSMLLDVLDSSKNQKELKDKLILIMKDKLETFDSLEEALNQFGFVPDIEHDENQNVKSIIFNQCPFQDVIGDNPWLCDIDHEVLKEMTDQNLQMDCCIASGEKQCEFQVTQK